MGLNLDRFKKSLVYRSSATARAVQADVSALRRLDHFCEVRQKWWVAATILAPLAGIGLAVAAVANNHNVVLWSLAGVGLVGFVVALVLMLSYRRLNYENRRYELVNKLLTLLERDMAREAILETRLDLRAANEKSKFTGKGEIGPWKVKYYRDPWLDLSGRLLDGTCYSLTMTELFQHRSRWARSRSGKQKYKSKTKSATEAALTLRIKEGRYPHLETLQRDAKGAIQLPDRVILKRLTFDGRDVELRVRLKGEWDVSTSGKRVAREMDGAALVGMMFLSLYQIFNLSRAMKKAETA